MDLRTFKSIGDKHLLNSFLPLLTVCLDCKCSQKFNAWLFNCWFIASRVTRSESRVPSSAFCASGNDYVNPVNGTSLRSVG